MAVVYISEYHIIQASGADIHWQAQCSPPEQRSSTSGNNNTTTAASTSNGFNKNVSFCKPLQQCCIEAIDWQVYQ